MLVPVVGYWYETLGIPAFHEYRLAKGKLDI